MSNAIQRDLESVNLALEGHADDVTLVLSRSTAELLKDVLTEREAEGAVTEVSPAQAAQMLRVSRATVRRFMDEGKLGYRKVGSHFRIPLESLTAFKDWERAQKKSGIEGLAVLQNELGLFD